MSKVLNPMDLDNYSGGMALPEGDYAVWFEGKNWKPEQGKEPARLGVMLTAVNLHDPKDIKEKFLSMGGQADKSFVPNPDDGGKSFLPIPGAPAQTWNNQTNWFLFLESLYSCGLPRGQASNLADVDGVWVHIQNVPEPEDRKTFAKKGGATSEAQTAEPERKAGKVPVVTEILEGGKPWEGGGGMPADATAKAAPKASPKAPAAPKATPAAPKPGPKAPTAAPKAVVAAEDVDLKSVAELAMTNVLLANEKGMAWLKFRVAAHEGMVKATDKTTASAAVDAFFGDDDSINSLLEPLGFKKEGGQVKPTE